MQYTQLHLNQLNFEKPDSWPRNNTRKGFGFGLLKAAEQDPAVVGLCADLTESLRMTDFAQRFPNRFFEMGVAEQNMMGVAAGLAMAGKVPFAASYAVFSPGLSWAQLRMSVCYSNLNVKVVGSHAGLNVGPDGATHQALEDIALTRVLPNLTVISPCDQDQAAAATLAAAKHPGAVYLRLARADSTQLTTPKTPFVIGQAQLFKPGSDLTIIATGQMVIKALEAAHHLTAHNISAEVINVHTIKPLDRDTLLESAAKTKGVVVVEEHQQAGGLGSAVAELLSQELPTPMQLVGVANRFGESGKPDELHLKYGLTVDHIMQAARKVLWHRKRGYYVHTL